MWKNRAGWGLLLAAALGLYLFENGTGTRLLLAAAIALPLCAALTLLPRPRLTAELRFPERMERGGMARGTLVLKNDSKLPAARVVCRVELVHSPTGERTAVTVTRGIAGGGTVAAALTLSAARCGTVEAELAGVRMLGAFGLFSRKAPCKAGASVLVTPRFRTVDGSPDDGPLSDSQEYSAQRAGSDPSETFQIREYVPGDPIRQIHWKLSQKTGRILVRELGLPIEEHIQPLPEPETEQDAGGLTCTAEPEPARRGGLLWRAGAAAVLCAAFLGALCGMAGLGVQAALVLIPSGALAAVLILLPERWGRWLCLTALGAAAALCMFGWPVVSDGAKLLLNRLFAASEARQAYIYDRFTVSAPEREWTRCMIAALLPLGLLTGGLCGRSRTRRKGAIALFLALAAGSAYLGVAPGTGWCVLLAACLATALLDTSRWEWTAAALGILAAVCAVVLLAFPGEDSRLSAWEEGARDALAFHATAQVSQQEETRLPEMEQTPEGQPLHEDEETRADPGGGLTTWAKPLTVFWVLLLLTAALFIPSAASDWLKKRRARNRRGLDDPDNSAAIRAAFLYALRWLGLGGVTLDNVPFSRYAPQVGEKISPALQARFEEALPLWQEAAYSAHAMDSAQREAMLAFLKETQRVVWDRLGKKERFRARYIDAL